MNPAKISITCSIVFILSALTCSNLNASQIKLGLKLGGNVSKLTGDYALHDNSKEHSRNRFYPGYGTGLFLELPLKNFSLQTEVNYRQKSLYYSQNSELVGGGWNGRVRFNYLEIPVLYRHNFMNSRKQYFVVGPTINFLLNSGELKYHRSNTAYPDANYDYITCIDDYFKPVTLGLTTGLGSTMLNKSKFAITVELRVNYDLTSATDKVDFVDLNTGEEWYFDGSRFFDIALNFCFVYKFKQGK